MRPYDASRARAVADKQAVACHPSRDDIRGALERVGALREQLKIEADLAALPRTANFLRFEVDDELQLLEHLLGEELARPAQ
jgi:hypothetical protein